MLSNAELAPLLDELESLLSDNHSSRAFASAPNTDQHHSLFDLAFSINAASSGDASPHREAKEEINRLLQQTRVLCRAPQCPIVAIMGLLNAGKSSLVSTFLDSTIHDPDATSPDREKLQISNISRGESRPSAAFSNRDRVLIGSGNSQGTHRFVLWMPESWRRDATLWKFALDQTRAVFGHEPEFLAEQPDRAAEQYNDTTPRHLPNADGELHSVLTISIPLIATDPQLDRWGIALLDCPDVQTGFLPGEATSIAIEPSAVTSQVFQSHVQSVAEARQRILARVAPLSSAFVVVVQANSLHDRTVSQILMMLNERMPTVPRILAVNRVPRRYTAREIQSEVRELYARYGIQRCYLAYHFEGPQQRDRLPTPPVGLTMPANEQLPLFFQIDAEPPPQPPAPIADDQWLLHLGQQLDKKNLFQSNLQSSLKRLSQCVRDACKRATTTIGALQFQHAALQRSAADACLSFSIDQSSSASHPKVRLQASRQIIQQIAKSLERTAPWWAMPGRWTNRIAEFGRSQIAGVASFVQLPSWFTGKTQAIGQWVRSRFTQGQTGKVVTADALLDHLQQQDRGGYLRLDDSSEHRDAVRAACQQAIDRFQQESRIELDDKELDAYTRRMWTQMPISKRLLTGFAPAGIAFAPLLAVIMLPLDFGGSAVLVLASLKELLFAGAAGVGLILASSDRMPHIAESEAAWHQLGDLYAVLCDALGLTRPGAAEMPQVHLGNQLRPLPPSPIPVQTSKQSMEILALSLTLNEASSARVESLLKTISDMS